jgi:hypothetical protein
VEQHLALLQALLASGVYNLLDLFRADLDEKRQPPEDGGNVEPFWMHQAGGP